MADQASARPAAPFPQPPPFYKHFTAQNQTELRRRQKQAEASATTTEDSRAPSTLDLVSLPPELRYLLPPALPAATTTSTPTLHTFSQPLNPSHPTNATLADLDIQRLYPSNPSNPHPHLIALARSLLTTFLHLFGAQSQNAEVWEPDVKHLQALVANMHELINLYRPKQARETVILALEERAEGLRGEIKGIREGRVKAEELLRGLWEAGEEEVKEEARGHEAVQREEGGRKVRQREAWRVLEDELGSS
ncbi:hypothetical protein B0A50_04247 [Salinomyces thailandicus]|uniref:Mediator of RNA polymerase II transcription subunit 7 n=1 Tax=Salinomyces thailandicus TaxID=706561 RepID=A0A4U0TWK4_9PEZI|nr:hypothetical protein B0A50_04247 [Salinomyces thailandica]